MQKTKLSIIPLPDPRLVPRYLLEQVKDREWDVDQWYKYQLAIKDDITNVLLGLVDSDNQIKGVLWLTVDGFSKLIFINTLSIDRQYQFKKIWLTVISKYVKEFSSKLQINRIIWAARRTKRFKSLGFKESDYKLMETRM